MKDVEIFQFCRDSFKNPWENVTNNQITSSVREKCNTETILSSSCITWHFKFAMWAHVLIHK